MTFDAFSRDSRIVSQQKLPLILSKL